jgi:hypothetical protein
MENPSFKEEKNFMQKPYFSVNNSSNRLNFTKKRALFQPKNGH